MTFMNTWGSAKVNDGESTTDPPGEGDFEVLLVAGGAFTSKAGNEIVKLDLRVISAEDESLHDYEWTVLYGFSSQGQANVTKTACHRLGIDVDTVVSLPDLDAELKAVAGGRFFVTVTRKGEYLNTYIDGPSRQLGGEPTVPAQSADDATLVPASEVPF